VHGITKKPQANRWAILAVGLVAQMTFSATFLGLPAASLLLQGSLGLSTGELAVVLGAASIAVVVTEFPWGVAADRFGERRVLLLGVVGAATALAAVAIVTSAPYPSVWMLAGALFIGAAFGGAVTGPSGSAILGWFAERRHGTLVSLRVAAVPAGGAVGTLAYSWLLSHGGAPLMFVVFATACALCALLVWVFVFDPSVHVHVHENEVEGGIPARPASRPAPRPALRQPGVWRVAASGLLLDISQFFVLTFAAALLADQYGYAPLAGVGVVAVMQFVGGALRVAAGVGTDLVPWLTRTIVVRGAAILQAACLVVVAISPRESVTAALIAMLIAGIVSCAWQGAHFAQITTLAGPGQAGTALGLNNAATSLGAFLPQVVAGALAVAAGWGSTTILLGVVPALLAAVVFPRGHR